MKKDKSIKSKVKIDINKMGLNIDKNEYQEIVLSNSNSPEKTFLNKKFLDY